jgi:hypothetical protein
VNGLFMIIGRKMVLTIPLPTIARLVSTKIVNGELEVTLEVTNQSSAVDLKRDGGGIDSARPWV